MNISARSQWPSSAVEYSRAHSPNFPPLHLRHSSFSNPSVASPTSQLILQPFRCFTYVTVHSPTLLCFSYVTSSSLNSPGEPPMRRGQLKGPKNIYNMGSKLDSFLRRRRFLFCFVHVVLLISLEIMRKNLHQYIYLTRT